MECGDRQIAVGGVWRSSVVTRLAAGSEPVQCRVTMHKACARKDFEAVTRSGLVGGEALALQAGLFQACANDDLPPASDPVRSLFQHLRHDSVRPSPIQKLSLTVFNGFYAGRAGELAAAGDESL